MSTPHSLHFPLAAAALCAAAFSPVAAQQAAAPDYIRPVVELAAVTPGAPILRTVAVYRFPSPRDAGMPAQVTLADSSGQLVAAYRLAGARSVSPMMVEVLNNDLVLQGETPSGVLTLVLYRQAAPEATGAFAGHWLLGDRQGELRGDTTH